jgi:hypothetical protein
MLGSKLVSRQDMLMLQESCHTKVLICILLMAQPTESSDRRAALGTSVIQQAMLMTEESCYTNLLI